MPAEPMRSFDPPPARAETHSRVMLRPLANPLPIGLLAFAMGSLVTAAYALGWVPAREQLDVAIVLLAFAFPLEFLPIPFALLARDAITAASLAIFSAAWLVNGLILLTSPLGATSQTLGVFALMQAALIMVPAIAAAPQRPALAVGLAVAAAQSVLGGLGALTDGRNLTDASALVALVLAGAALYPALALLLEDAFGRTVLPITRRRAARKAIEDPLDEQVADLASEVGVRRTL